MNLAFGLLHENLKPLFGQKKLDLNFIIKTVKTTHHNYIIHICGNGIAYYKLNKLKALQYKYYIYFR